MTVFADRNRVEKEETFELASAARDRFMFELTHADADRACRAPLAGVRSGVSRCGCVARARRRRSVLPWRGAERHRRGDSARACTATETLERYVLDLWDATVSPQKFGIRIEGVDMDKLVLAGASPRGMMSLMRAARVVAWLAGRTHLLPDDIYARRPVRRWVTVSSSHRCTNCAALRSPMRSSSRSCDRVPTPR